MAGFLTATLCADEVAFAPVADTTLLQIAPDNNMGAQTFVNAGMTQNGTRNRGLFQFDVSQIPQGATITSAYLVLEVVHQPSDGYAAADFGLHRVFQPWGEGNKTAASPTSPGQGSPATIGEATWNDRFALMGQPWAAPGGAPGTDYAAAISSDQFVYSIDQYIFPSKPLLVADVQGWVNDPLSNHGWMLIGEGEDARFTARRFASREDPNGLGPELVVDFEPVPEPGTLAVFGLGSLLIFCFARWKKI